MASCVCCSACKPRYKRLVDNIFPSVQEDGLVRSEMEKLTYYAVSAPEKLDRIGVYLAKKLTRDIQRRRDKAVFIAMEALNQLLLACHAQQINLFVESFLKMVATLLESDNYEFQVLGTNSFEKFSKIEEDTPSYHRRYDFFVSKFSSMCHSNAANTDTQQKMQLHGVRGLRGVIRKTVSDELQVNIWEKQHMDKIIPSLLFTMQSSPNKHLNEDGSPVPSDDIEQPWALAEESLRELLSRAAFANVPAAIVPALAHMDDHNLWAPDNAFAIKCFKIVMYSIPGQYSHVTVKMLLDHLDAHTDEDETIQASMLQVLCAIVPIPASTAIGPSVIDVFNRLAKHLKLLADGVHRKGFEAALIDTTGVLAGVVPDYQKLEIMSFYINKAHEALSGHGSLEELTKRDTKYSNLLLQCLHRISKAYHVNNLSSLSSSLLDPLIKVALLTDPTERLLAQSVLLSLLDKHNNKSKLLVVKMLDDVECLHLTSSLPGKHDADFVDRRLPSIYHWLFESFILDDNTTESYILLFKCVSVLCLSLTSPEVIMELCRLTLAVQSAIIDWLTAANPSDAVIMRASLVMASLACNMLVLSHFSAVPQFQHYVRQILLAREIKVPQFHPYHLAEPTKLKDFKLDGETLTKVTFSSTGIYDVLSGCSGFNVNKLNQPFLANLPLDNLSSDGQRNAIDVESINIAFAADTEVAVTEADGRMPAHAITYNYLKQVASKPPPSRAEQIAKNQKVTDHILSVPFEQLVAEMKPDPVTEAKKWIDQVIAAQTFSPEDDEGIDAFKLPSVYTYCY